MLRSVIPSSRGKIKVGINLSNSLVFIPRGNAAGGYCCYGRLWILMCNINSDYFPNAANYPLLNSRKQLEKTSILVISLGCAYIFVLQSLNSSILTKSFLTKKCIPVTSVTLMSHKKTHSTKSPRSLAFCFPANCHVLLYR